MHDQWKDEFEEALRDMSDPEKAELIEHIVRSMHGSDESSDLLSPQDVAARFAQIAALPQEGPRDGFSGRDHDSVLYGSAGGRGA